VREYCADIWHARPVPVELIDLSEVKVSRRAETK